MLKKKVSLVLVVPFIACACLADMVKFTDFEQYSDGQVLANSVAVSTDDWTKSTGSIKSFAAKVEATDGNQYLLHDHTGAVGGNATLVQDSSGFLATTASDGFQTLFFRFMIDSSQGTAGYAGLGVAANVSDVNPLAKTGFKVDGSGNILNPDLTAVGVIELDTWYNAWFLVDHRGAAAGSSASLYLQSADDVSFSTQTLVAGSFYNAPGASPYDTILIDSEQLNGVNFAIDDVYYDNAGMNLINPIPEPATLGLLAFSSFFILLLRRIIM